MIFSILDKLEYDALDSALEECITQANRSKENQCARLCICVCLFANYFSNKLSCKIKNESICNHYWREILQSFEANPPCNLLNIVLKETTINANTLQRLKNTYC